MGTAELLLPSVVRDPFSVSKPPWADTLAEYSENELLEK